MTSGGELKEVQTRFVTEVRHEFLFFFVLLYVSHITANEHNSSHSNILYRKILNTDYNMKNMRTSVVQVTSKL